MHTSKEWFKYWFDSPYYHILYQNRDNTEAHHFMDNLVNKFDIKPGHKILDAGCGKGRHAIYLHNKGLHVTGFDISPHSIKEARKYGDKGLHFYVHDIREVFAEEQYDMVLNLFTSFGYFEDDEENQQAIDAMVKALIRGGYIVIDFMNTKKILQNLIPYEEKKINNTWFYISRYVENKFLVKKITFDEDGGSKEYVEKVRKFDVDDFREFFNKAGLTLEHCYGDYDLNTFDEEKSERMILVGNKQ